MPPTSYLALAQSIYTTLVSHQPPEVWDFQPLATRAFHMATAFKDVATENGYYST